MFAKTITGYLIIFQIFSSYSEQLFKKYIQYMDQLQRAGEQLMTNHQNGKSIALLWDNYEFKTRLTDFDFDKNTLKHAK